MSMDVDRLVADETSGWKRLADVFARIPAGRFEEPTLTPEGWSPKDAMFHVGAWMDDCGSQLERIRAGSFDPTEETRDAIERQNAAWFRLSQSMDPTEVRSGFEAARVRMLEEFGRLGEVTPEAWEWFEESGPLHYAKHGSDLEAWLDP
jgi:Mycothiol maleylpyruvate isomerase N-terminal domain